MNKHSQPRNYTPTFALDCPEQKSSTDKQSRFPLQVMAAFVIQLIHQSQGYEYLLMPCFHDRFLHGMMEAICYVSI